MAAQPSPPGSPVIRWRALILAADAIALRTAILEYREARSFLGTSDHFAWTTRGDDLWRAKIRLGLRRCAQARNALRRAIRAVERDLSLPHRPLR